MKLKNIQKRTIYCNYNIGNMQVKLTNFVKKSKEKHCLAITTKQCKSVILNGKRIKQIRTVSYYYKYMKYAYKINTFQDIFLSH